MLAGLDCQFQSSPAHCSRKLPLHLRQNLFLLFKEALTNVARHSQASGWKLMSPSATTPGN